jgi:alpha-maltose-1-phosphate synthase
MVITAGKALLRRWPNLYKWVGDTYYRGEPIYRVARSVRANLTRPWWLYAPLLHRPASPRARSGQDVRLIVMLVVSEVWRDPRVERGARALASGGYRVKIIYPDFFSEVWKIPPIDWGENISFRPLPKDAMNFAFEFPWVCGDAMLAAACEERPFAFHCHDLSTSIIGLVAAARTGALCVCDFHEWYSENVSWSAFRRRYVPHSPLKRHLFKACEAIVMTRATAVVTVCDSIARDLAAQHEESTVPITVVRNIPHLKPIATAPERDLRMEIGVGPDELIVLYQGGVGPARHIEPIIEAMRDVPRSVLVIRGPGIEAYRDAYLALAASNGVAGRVFCLPPVSSADVVTKAAQADVGIWTLPNLCKNFYYALPNKIFEYLAAGLPTLAADFPEARRIIETYEVGLVFDPDDPRSIATAINRLADEPETRRRMRANVAIALADMSADREWHKLAALYDGLAGTLPIAESA